MDAIKAEVLNLISHYKEKHGKEWGHYFFNRFETELPGGDRRQLAPDEKPWEEDQFASEKKRGLTRREFWAAIDEVVASVHILPEYIIAQRERTHQNGDQSLYATCTLVYIQLRRQGYNDHDLCS